MPIKKPSPKKGNRITASPAIDYDKKFPLFSLEKIVDGDYCLSKLDQEHKSYFADAIFKRKATTWLELKSCPKHGLGFEKIDRKSIKAGIPKFITPEVDHFLAFRFHGKKPMVGYRQLDVFYVLWFDCNFTLYDHG